jgi:hypothetical protein
MDPDRLFQALVGAVVCAVVAAEFRSVLSAPGADPVTQLVLGLVSLVAALWSVFMLATLILE